MGTLRSGLKPLARSKKLSMPSGQEGLGHSSDFFAGQTLGKIDMEVDRGDHDAPGWFKNAIP